MGYTHRNDEIHDNITRMQREWEAQRDALATALISLDNAMSADRLEAAA
jgi:hypothetical protein